ncbi:MAG TPA: AAA family ATPase [Terriglobales bacterium]|nr:AAA family ATPase [Terriglobales bacterium]
MGTIICIANQKGGVGKTTTAVNLASGLAMDGHATLLIDLDPQASASSGVGMRPKPDQANLYEVLLSGLPAGGAVQASALDHLSVLPASRDLVGAEIELVPMLARERRLAEVLAPIRQSFELILIDCPPSLGLLTLNALTAADSVLIPLQCEYYALEGLSALLETIELVRGRLNPALKIEGLVLTMFDTRNTLSHQVATEVRTHFPADLFETVIPRNVRLSESPSHGLPAVVYDPTSRGAQAYRSLAAELVARRAAASHPTAGQGETPPSAADAEPSPAMSVTGETEHQDGSE